MKIIILALSPDTYATKRIVEEGKKKGHEVSVISPLDLYILISNKKGHDRVYNKGSRLYLSDIDAIIPRIGGASEFGAVVVEHLANNMGVFCTSSALGILTCTNKILTTLKLSQNRVPVPQTIYANQLLDYEWLLNQVNGFPFVAKTLLGSQGKTVSIMETPLATKTALSSYFHSKVNLLFQEFVNASGKDIRAFVVGGKIVASMERVATEGDFRANISIGGQGKKVELTTDEIEICLRAAEAVHSSGICGVDIMREKDGGAKVIECNSNPNLEGIEAVTGINVAGKIIEYVEISLSSKESGNKNQTHSFAQNTAKQKIDEATRIANLLQANLNHPNRNELLNQANKLLNEANQIINSSPQTNNQTQTSPQNQWEKELERLNEIYAYSEKSKKLYDLE